MEQAWNFIWNNFFCEKTELIYDYLVHDCNDKLTGHLPSTDEIARQIPNPCGWGTGMEDSVLSAGSMMDAVVARYNVTGNSNMKALADILFRGMMRCVVDIDNGFIARSVSPADGKSFYFDTSRDQYTHWIYGALRLYNSDLCTEKQRKDITDVLTAVAMRLENNVTDENQYNMLRFDGKTSIAGKMWGELGAHEYLRLPFFFISAWYVTNNKHWHDLYMKYRDKAFEKSLLFNAQSYGQRCYPVLQMQYSLRALFEMDPDFRFREKCLALMKRIADNYILFAPSESKHLCSNTLTDFMYYQYKPWNKVKMLYLGIIGDRAYFNPGQSELYENRGFYAIRNVGEAVSILALCPNRHVGDEQFEALQNLSSAIDYSRHCSYAPMLLACGYWLAVEANMNIQKRKLASQS